MATTQIDISKLVSVLDGYMNVTSSTSMNGTRDFKYFYPKNVADIKTILQILTEMGLPAAEYETKVNHKAQPVVRVPRTADVASKLDEVIIPLNQVWKKSVQIDSKDIQLLATKIVPESSLRSNSVSYPVNSYFLFGLKDFKSADVIEATFKKYGLEADVAVGNGMASLPDSGKRSPLDYVLAEMFQQIRETVLEMHNAKNNPNTKDTFKSASQQMGATVTASEKKKSINMFAKLKSWFNQKS